jgi:hypothetical protein
MTSLLASKRFLPEIGRMMFSGAAGRKPKNQDWRSVENF